MTDIDIRSRVMEMDDAGLGAMEAENERMRLLLNGPKTINDAGAVQVRRSHAHSRERCLFLARFSSARAALPDPNRTRSA